MKRAIIISMITTLLLVLLIILLLTTSLGLNISILIAKWCLPGKLSIIHPHGRLLGPISVDHIHYHSERYDFAATDLTLNWNIEHIPTIFINWEQFAAQISHKSITSHHGSITLTGNQNAYQLQLSNQIQLGSSATIALNLLAHGTSKQLSLTSVQLHSQQSNLQFIGHLTWQPFTLNLKPISGQIRQHAITGSLTLSSHEENNLTTNAKLSIDDNFFKLSGTIADDINLHWTLDSNYLHELYPNMKGRLNIYGTALGRINTPKITASIDNNDQITLPELGITLKNIHLLAQVHGANQLSYSATATSGNGQLAIDGQLKITDRNIVNISNIQGNNFQIMNTSEYQVNITPALKLVTDNHNLYLTGKITIPYAAIAPTQLLNTVNLSKDVVFVEKLQAKKPIAFPLHSEVNIILGDKINIDHKGLTARLEGNIIVIDNPNQATTSKGEIYILDGTYKSYGEKLIIRQGKLIYRGNIITNPGLNIEAVHHFRKLKMFDNTQNSKHQTQVFNDEQIVGIRIQGTADNPNYTLFSEPSGLSQQQMLSYLLLGKPDIPTTGLDASLLLKGLSFLNIGSSKTSAVTEKLQKNFGFDEIRIGSEQVYSSKNGKIIDNTSLVLSKVLSPKLLVDYSIGLIEPINILRIQYMLNKYFSIRTESNTNAQGIDLFYHYERD